MMVNFIYNYFLAKHVCSKYGYKFVPKWSSKYDYMNPERKIVSIGIFGKYFIPTLFHEIGHVIDFKKRDVNENWQVYLIQSGRYKYLSSGRRISSVVQEEINASKFAVKFLKRKKLISKDWLQFLEDSFNSYFWEFNKWGFQQDLADVNYRFIKQLNINVAKENI